MKLYEIFGIGGNSLGFGGGGGTSLPSVQDTGALVISTSPLNLTAAASTTNAIVRFNSVATTGLMFGASTQVGLKVDATNWLAVDSNQNNGLSVPSTSSIGFSSSTTYGGAVNDAGFRRRGAGSLFLGILADVNGVPTAQTLGVQNAITGTNLPGSVFTIAAPLGTGNGAGSATRLQRALMQASGTTAQTNADAFVIGESKTLSNTSATTTALASISVPSNSGGGCSGFVTVVASDGTNFDSETQSFNVSYVNKATVLTIGTPAITASTAASNSGSTTIGLTVTAGTNAVNINVTPVFTTIVPTTVTAFIEIHNHGTGNVTIN